jgi:hypothetical protein
MTPEEATIIPVHGTSSVARRMDWDTCTSPGDDTLTHWQHAVTLLNSV